MVILAVPGLVVALSFTYLTEHFLQGRFYQTSPAPGAGLHDHVLPAGPRGRAGRGGPLAGRARGGGWLARRAASLSVLWRVTLPLIAPGLAAAFALVFLETATELTATLVLTPRMSRRWRPNSGPTNRTGPTARRPCTPGSWCSSPPCPGSSSGAGSTANPPRFAGGAALAQGTAAAPMQRVPEVVGVRDLRMGGVQVVRHAAGPARRRSGGPARVLHGDPRRIGKRQDDAVAHRGRVRAPRRRSRYVSATRSLTMPAHVSCPPSTAASATCPRRAPSSRTSASGGTSPSA